MKSVLREIAGPFKSNVSFGRDYEPVKHTLTPTSVQKRKPEEEIDQQGFKRWHGMKGLSISKDWRYQVENTDNLGDRGSKRMRISFTLPERDIELKPIYVTEGPLKGKKVLVIEELSYNLMSLSPELRVMIFRHLLVRGAKIVIGRPRDQTFLVNGTNRLSRRWTGHYEAIPEKRLNGFNLMLVSKAIREEAAEVVYGCNVFELRGARAAQQFLADIGDMSFFLRHVSLANIRPTSAGGQVLIRSLATLPQQIRNINLSWTVLVKNKTIGDDFSVVAKEVAQETWENGLETLGRLMQSGGSTVNEVSTLVNIIPSRHKICAWCLDGTTTSSMLQGNNMWLCPRAFPHCSEHYDRCEEIEAEIASKMKSLFEDDA